MLNSHLLIGYLLSLLMTPNMTVVCPKSGFHLATMLKVISTQFLEKVSAETQMALATGVQYLSKATIMDARSSQDTGTLKKKESTVN